MNRRDFIKGSIKLLATIPALAWLKPEVPAVEEAELELAPADDVIYLDNLFPNSQRQARWNGAGDSWESVDGGKTWNQTGFRPTLEIQPDGALYVSGDFLEEDIEIDYRDYYQPTNLSRMDGAGLWESTDGGKTWELAIKLQNPT